jgi:hypothetical protein
MREAESVSMQHRRCSPEQGATKVRLAQCAVTAMALKFDTKEQIPAEHLSLYVEREGASVLDLKSGGGQVKAHDSLAEDKRIGRQLRNLPGPMQESSDRSAPRSSVSFVDMLHVPCGCRFALRVAKGLQFPAD